MTDPAPVAPTPTNFRAAIAANVAAAPPGAAAPTPSAPSNPSGPPPQTRGLQSDAAPTAPTQAAEGGAEDVHPLAQPGATIDPEATPEGGELDAQADATANAPADPLAEVVHGVAARDVLDAIKAGELPPALADKVMIRVKVNGNELPVSVGEAGRGYMRISDYTNAKMQLSESRAALDADKGKLREVFTGWDTPEGLAAGLDKMGLIGSARDAVTKSWGTPQAPNVRGFIEDLRRMGHHKLLSDATVALALEANQRFKAFGGDVDPQRAEQLIAHFEQSEAQQWDERVRLEREREAVKAELWKIKRDALLAQQQKQSAAPDANAFVAQVHTLKTAEFARVGITATPIADQYFARSFQHADRVLRERGTPPKLSEVVQMATQITMEQLGDDRAQHGGTAAPAQQHAAAPPAALPARPTAAPMTSAAAKLPSTGTADDFASRLAALRAATPGRR
jgi:hypothetical protein